MKKVHVLFLCEIKIGVFKDLKRAQELQEKIEITKHLLGQ